MEGLYKYSSTLHLPWSPGVSRDDKVHRDVSHFYGKRGVITEKMDGENTSLYNNWYHARSLDSKNHPSRNWVKGLWGSIKHEIPDGWRICGENLYAKHSIYYEDLMTYFMVFSIWDEKNICLNWKETVEYCSIFGLQTVPVLYEGILTEDLLRNFHKSLNLDKQEGFVIRIADEFHYDDFELNMAKWVRKGHVQTDEHWMLQEIVPNQLKKKNGSED